MTFDKAKTLRAAEKYLELGKIPAAIKEYTQIVANEPDDFATVNTLGDTEIATSLADLYARQDLVVEARAHYLAVADAHNRSGARQEALGILRKIADLDPQNTDIRVKLAEGYLKEGMRPEAAACFTEAGQRLLTRTAFDVSLEMFGKALELLPSDLASLKG